MCKPVTKTRCKWCGTDPLYVRYHDEEWGVPVHDDRRLFEMLILEGAQAGLSWITILRKRPAYRRAFDRFDARRIAKYGAAKKRALLADSGIVRNRLKIDAAIANARAFLAVRQEFGTFDRYIWQFAPADGAERSRAAATSTAESDAMSRDLKTRGFKFVGSTICHAFMQAVGMVNDHVEDCYKRRERTGTTRTSGNQGRTGLRGQDAGLGTLGRTLDSERWTMD
jgi:DNA-3-methyladenine glycosylase I